MKKASEYRYLEAFVMRYGGAGGNRKGYTCPTPIIKQTLVNQRFTAIFKPYKAYTQSEVLPQSVSPSVAHRAPIDGENILRILDSCIMKLRTTVQYRVRL